MAQDFELIFSTRLDESKIKTQVQKATNDLSKIATIKTRLQVDTSSLKDVKTELSTIQNTIDNYNNNSVQSFTKMTKAVQVVKTETDKYRLSNDGLREVITKTNAAGQQFRTIIDKVTDGQGRLVTTTQNLTREQSNGLKYWTQYGEKIEEVVTDYAKAEDETNDLRDKIAQLNKVEEQNVTNTQNMGTAMGETSNHAVTLGQKILDATKKVALFKVSTTFVSAFYNSLNEAVEVVKDYNATMTEFLKVTTLSTDGVKELESSLTNIGENVGRTRNELLGISTELTKAGYQSKQELETLSELVAMYQNTADEELSVAEASSVLISMMKAFNIEANDAIHITDAINQVSQDFAVSSGDLGKGLTQAGAALATYGNSFDETIGLT